MLLSWQSSITMYLTLLSFQWCYSVHSFHQAGVCNRIEAESSKKVHHVCTFMNLLIMEIY